MSEQFTRSAGFSSCLITSVLLDEVNWVLKQRPLRRYELTKRCAEDRPTIKVEVSEHEKSNGDGVYRKQILYN